MGRGGKQRKLKSDQQSKRPLVAIMVGVVLIACLAVAAFLFSSRASWNISTNTKDATTRTKESVAWNATEQPSVNAPHQVPPATKSEGQLPVNLGLSWDAVDNPVKDGWTTEAFSDEAGSLLKKLGDLILVQPDAQQFEPLVSETFSCDPLLPVDLQIALSDESLVVERRTSIEATETASSETNNYSGALRLAEAAKSLMAPLDGAQGLRWKFKVVRVDQDGDWVKTQQYVSLSGRTADKAIEQNATWSIQWKLMAGKKPVLDSIHVTDFEQVTYKQSGQTIFADCTQSVLGQNDCYESQFLHGMNHWLNRSQDTRYFYLLGNPGMAVGDVDGDGLDDIYVCQEEGLPNRLFLQAADGSARDVSDEWGVDWLHNSRGALIIDLDNDADQDLVVAMVGHVIVASNEGGRFEIRNVLSTDEDNMSLSAADYDNDGDLDIYVCALNDNVQLRGDTTQSGSLAGLVASDNDELDGGRNVLFANQIEKEGGWKFVDVTQEAGLDTLNQRLSYAASWDDYDNDSDLDLYVANDYGQNNLFRNDNGKFTDVTSSVGATDSAFGMSASWGDYDRDGWMDMYVSNMFSAAGGRVTHQDRYLQESPETKQRLQRFAKGNTMLRNDGSGAGFTDVSDQAAVAVGRWAWGSNFVDINNDGWDDLVVANGFLTTEDTGDL